jgi:hypothetical protein
MKEGYYKPRKTIINNTDKKNNSSARKKIPNKESKPSSNAIGGYSKRITYDKSDSESGSGLQKGGGKIGGYIKPRVVSDGGPGYNPMKKVIWILLFLVIAVAIVVLIFFTNALNQERIKDSGLATQDLEMKISQAHIEKDSIDLKIDIDSKEHDLVGVKIIVDDGTNFDIFKIELSKEEIEKGEIHLEFDRVDGDKVTKILVSPILNTPERKGVIGSVEESYTPKKTDFAGNTNINPYPEPQDIYYPYTGGLNNTNQTGQNKTNLTNCAEQGEKVYLTSSGENQTNWCCEGLEIIYPSSYFSILNKCYWPGFFEDSPAYGVCSDCGNGICEDVEDVCSCEADCLEKNNSDYFSIQDFCINGYEIFCSDIEYLENMEKSYASEHYENLSKICRLCNVTTQTSPSESPAYCYNILLRACYQGSVYQYNSCSNSWEINETCKENEYCYVNKCVPREEPEIGCGNGILEQGEYCELNNLAGETCSGFGFNSGELACNPDTCEFDLSGCYNENSIIESDCIPNCEGKECGSDGCTGICGSCSSTNPYCNNEGKCVKCTSNSECNDNNACTTDTCSSGTCYNTPISGCCTSNSECNDNNACTTDTCTSSNVCSHTNACASDEECVNKICVKKTQPLTGAIIADHNAADDFDIIPSCWIERAKQQFRIAYEHTSHGSQLSTGLAALENLKGSPYYIGTGSKDLYFHDDAMASYATSAEDLGYSGWSTATRNYLNSHSNINVIMWSWCGQVNDHENDMDSHYLNPAESIKKDYGVEFIYMTGHLESNQAVKYANDLIRNHVQEVNGILFDFADIEKYDPAGNAYLYGTDACEWCSTWCSANSDDGCSGISCTHSHSYNCYRKARAFWWMMARMAGWDGTANDACP